jgi:hypothetical protein
MTKETEKKETKNSKEDLEEIKSLLKDILAELQEDVGNEDFFKPYRLSDADEAGTIKYYGYLKKNGDWVIEQYDSGAGTRRFARSDELVKRTKAEKGYSDAWANRIRLTYRLFYDIFPEVNP